MADSNKIQAAQDLKKGNISNLLRNAVIVLVLICCIIIFTVISPVFFTLSNFQNILLQNSYLVVATLGMTILLIGGGVDLSAGYLLGFGCVIAAKALMEWHLPDGIAILLCIAVCTLMSCLNAILVIKIKINALMVTLATMTIFSGISFLVSNGQSIYNLPESFKFYGQGSVGGFPISAIIMIGLIILIIFIMNSTYLGRYIYAVGGNPEAARLAGIKTDKIRMITYLIGGICFGVSAFLLVSRSGSASSGMAVGNEFTAITAAVLGGVAIQGGEGKIWSVVVGAFILGILLNGFQIIGLGVYVQSVVKGVILIVAMGINMYQRSKDMSAIKQQ
jgi:Ribose/xylose/arabinose/galactoside ABC-type transport systems, permease components